MTSLARRTTVTSLALLMVSTVSPFAAHGSSAQGAAAGTPVDVVDMAFAKASVTVPVGGSVTWRFRDSMAHSSTSDDGFWDSGPQSHGDRWSRAFSSAGSFGYNSSTHADMHGRVRVRPTATGTPKGGYTVRWASKAVPGVAVDLQSRTGAGRWETWLANTSSLTGRFDRAGIASWQIRARSRDTASREVSGWSPAVTVAVR